MGSHRKPRTGLFDSPAARRGAMGVGAAALASATLLSQHAYADDNDSPAVEEQRNRADAAAERAAGVKERVDALYRQAGTATQEYNAADEAVTAQQEKADALLDKAAEAAEQVNEARRELGQFAAAHYRTGGLGETATLLLADDPQSYFDTRRTLSRMTERQHRALDDYTQRQAEAAEQRRAAAGALEELEERQRELREKKEEVQGKLGAARTLLAELTAEEKKEFERLERLEEEEAERRAEAERQEREERERQEREQAEREQAGEDGSGQGSGTGTGGGTGGGTETPGDSTGTRAQQVIAFAEAQIGKPYVWGATGPNSYDCSGLTQAAWRQAGVELPRVTFDQVNVGTKVARADLRPGDLVFFYSDVSHVGIYIGDGKMIHAPKPGDVVKVESIDYMPWHSANRVG